MNIYLIKNGLLRRLKLSQVINNQHLYCHQNSITELRQITQQDVDSFTKLTGDENPIHSVNQPEVKRLVPGALLNSLMAGIIGTKLPGPGSVVVSQEFSFPNKCIVNEQIQFYVKLVEQRKIMKVSYECKQCEKIVFSGSARLVKLK